MRSRAVRGFADGPGDSFVARHRTEPGLTMATAFRLPSLSTAGPRSASGGNTPRGGTGALHPAFGPTPGAGSTAGSLAELLQLPKRRLLQMVAALCGVLSVYLIVQTVVSPVAAAKAALACWHWHRVKDNISHIFHIFYIFDLTTVMCRTPRVK